MDVPVSVISVTDAGMPRVNIFVHAVYYLLRETDSLFSFAKHFHLALFLIFKKGLMRIISSLLNTITYFFFYHLRLMAK